MKFRRKTAPVFIPRSDSLNCDPTYELEMRIVGSSTLSRPKDLTPTSKEEIDRAVEEITRAFTAYNRQMHNLSQKQVISVKICF